MKLDVGQNGWYPWGSHPQPGTVAAHFTHDGIDYTVMALGGPLPTFTTVMTDLVEKDAFSAMGYATINDDKRAEASDFLLEHRIRA